MRTLAAAGLILVSAACALAQSPDAVIEKYIRAVGGMAAVEHVKTREIHARRSRSKLIIYWQKPNKVLLIDGKKRIGYDGSSGWMLSSKKRVSKLPKGDQIPLEMDANPLRYVYLKQLYPDVTAAGSGKLDGRAMDVLTAPNDRGSTKFLFDRTTHLLARIEETGETSAYFAHTTDFEDYQDRDGLKIPMRIRHESNEPGGNREELRISEISNNVVLKTEIFMRPAGGNVVLGGKR